MPRPKGSRSIITLADYKDIQKEVRKANQKIRRIQAKYGDDAWAVHNVTEKLSSNLINAINPYSGEIRIRKTMNQAQLNAVRRATNEFLRSKTSSITGIKEAKKNMQDSLKSTLSDENFELTDREAQALYRAVEDRDLRSTAEYIGASTLWSELIDAQKKNKSKDQFYESLLQHNIVLNDLDMVDDLERIYNIYMNKQ